MRWMFCVMLLMFTCGCSKSTASPPFPTTSPAASPSAPTPTPTPPQPPVGTFAARGVVKESGAGAIPGVLVETSTGRSTQTDGNGFYELSNLPRMAISFSKPGFEPRGPYGDYLMDHDTTINVVMQRSIWVPAGQALSTTLFRDDVAFVILSNASDHFDDPVCMPCKLVRVSVPANGPLTAQVTWSPSNSDVHLWIAQEHAGSRDVVEGHGESGTLTASLRVMAGVDALVLFGGTGAPLSVDVPIRLTTSLEP